MLRFCGCVQVAHIHKMQDTGCNEFSNRELDPTPARLLELGGISGVARNECPIWSKLQLFNQKRTASGSYYVLVEIVKRRSEHLWACSICF